MSSENAKPDQIQASVAAALSRLRGDLDPAGAPHGSGPRTDLGRADIGRPANDLRADPFFKTIQSPSPSTASATRGPIPMTPFARMQASHEAPPSDPIAPEEPTQPQEPGAMAEPPTMPEPASDLIAMPEPPAAPVTSAAEQEPAAPGGSASPLSRFMRGGAAQESGPTQRDLLADLPPPPISEPLTAEDDTSAMRRRRRNRMLLAGALAIIVIALGAWLWSGGEESKEVPVVTAEATPEKVKPADGGGLEVPNQNVQVLENMDGAAVQPEGETVLPPPEQPVAPPAPTAEQTPTVIDNNAAESTAAPDAPASAAPTAEAAAAPTVPAPEPTQSGTMTAAPVVPAPEVAQTPQAPATPDVTMDQPLPPAGASAESATGPTPVPDTTVPEQTTPEQTAPAQQAAQEAPAQQEPAQAATPAPATTQEAAVAPTAGNTRVQLAAGKSEDAVKKEWARLQQAHPDLLGGLSLTVQQVDKGSAGIFYRLQAGPLADAAAAKKLCASLKQQGQDCIVAR